MKLVVTGALGHIGSAVIRHLPGLLSSEGEGLEMVMIDNMRTQRYPSLFNLPEGVDYKFIEGDVIEDDIRPLIDGATAVIHLAAITDAAASFDKAAEVEYVNYTATDKVARACLETGASLFHLSSTSVYGTAKDVVSEDSPPEDVNPQSPYAETKLKEEELCAELGGQGLKYISCRFGTIAGVSPGMRFHTAVNKFCWQAVMGTPLTVWQTAYDQKRPYLDLSDGLRAMVQAIEQDIFDNRIYNILTGNKTVRNIVDAIRSHVPDLEVNFVEAKIMNQLSYDVARQRALDAGFVFEGSIDGCIAETISWLRKAGGRA